jgi:hypothetical protein
MFGELAAGANAAVVDLEPLAAGTAHTLVLLAPSISPYAPPPGLGGVWEAARAERVLVAIEASAPLA